MSIQAQVRAELLQRIERSMRGAAVARGSGAKVVSMNEWRSHRSRGLGAFSWGDMFGEILKGATSIYAGKEVAKAQGKAAERLAAAEAQKMLAETELQLAQAKTLEEQSQLLAKQSELQRVIKSMSFTGVQQWLLAGVGVAALVLLVVAVTGKRGRR